MSGQGLNPGLVALWLERVLDESGEPISGDRLTDLIKPLLARIWEDGHADFEDMPNPYGKATDYALESGQRHS